MEECAQLLKIPSEMEEALLYTVCTPHTVYSVETALEQKGYRVIKRLSIVQPPCKARGPEGLHAESARACRVE